MQDKYPFAKVAIIVPCYNQGEYLAECLESVFQQTFSDWICIVVNDGSTDKTQDVVERFRQRDHRIYYFKQSNQGVAAARNNGINSCDSEFILPLDADDRLARSYLETTVKVLMSDRDINVVYSQCQLFGNTNQIFVLPNYSFSTLLRSNIITSTALYRRHDFKKTSGYDEVISGLEDWDFWLSLLDKDSQVIRIDQVLFYYRRKETSRNRQAYHDPVLMNEVRSYIYDKHKLKYLDYPSDLGVLAFRIRVLLNNCRSAIAKRRISIVFSIIGELIILSIKYLCFRFVRLPVQMLNILS